MTDAAALLMAARPPFDALSAKGRKRLAEAATPLALPKGRSLFDQGDPSDAVYAVTGGAVAVRTVGEGGQETHLAELRPGSVFGEMAVLDGGPRTAGVVATADSHLLRLPGAVFLAVASEEPGFALALARDVVAKLRAADLQIEDRSVLGLEARLAKFLLANRDAEGWVRLTQAGIAERVGVTREAVNRRMRAWEEAGALSLRRGRVRVLDEGALGGG